MSVNWGGIADGVFGGLTDFDNQGSSGYNWMTFGATPQFNPISGGTDQKWGPEPSIGTQGGNAAGDFLSQHTNPIKGIASSSGASGNPPGMDQQSGIEKITDGLYLYNPAKFLGDYGAQMQQGSSSGSTAKSLLKNAAGAAVSFGISKALPLMFACDMRLKTDVSPLETTDVNDDLAEMAFFVKGLRECA
tara:strand:+ start:9 stop:578 length:570 start_codon:yes stop_codon:yes gene_type:complete